ncbi:MAG: transposase [Deltaproteobacteria bacterium]|nr:transposase [Deltaproteobacteria bacterium]
MQKFEQYCGTGEYIASRALQNDVNVAIALGRPLLIKGEPGTGKTLLGCMAYARRKFDEVVKANRKSGNNEILAAETALKYIGKLYAIEKEAKELMPDERYLMRQEKARPIMEAFGNWLWDTYPKTPPKGLLGKAIKIHLESMGTAECLTGKWYPETG